MTPTRKESLAWSQEARAYANQQTNDLWDKDRIYRERFAAIAYSAGRAQGLREAREVCEALAHEWRGANSRIVECAAAIKQLEVK